MILQAFIDDTRTNAKRERRLFMLGGIAATVDQWKAFSDEWSAKLREEPGLGYFKLSQALSLKDEFEPARGWTEGLRDARLFDLARIARKHATFGIDSSLDHGLYDEWVRHFSPFKELRDPYFLVFYQVIDAITAARELYPETTGLDYIFDEQGDIGLRAVELWKRMHKALPLRRPELMGSTPVHRNDRTFLPLQAADLYVGLKRVAIERGGEMALGPRHALRAFSDLQAWERAYTKDDLMMLTADLVVRRGLRKLGGKARRGSG